MDEEMVKSRSIPHALRTRLSPGWVKVLELLAVTGVPTTRVQALLNESCQRGSSKADSWEEVLQLLAENDAVIKNGSLLLQPVFLSLPAFLQTRLLYLLCMNAFKISSRELNMFVSTLEQVKTDLSVWLLDSVRVLRQHLVMEETCETQSAKTYPAYVFSPSSETLISDFVKTLTNQFVSLDKAEVATYDDVQDVLASRSEMARGENPQQPENSSRFPDPKAVDVIVIDDMDSIEVLASNVEFNKDSTSRKEVDQHPCVSHSSSELSRTANDVDTLGKITLKYKNTNTEATVSPVNELKRKETLSQNNETHDAEHVRIKNMRLDVKKDNAVLGESKSVAPTVDADAAMSEQAAQTSLKESAKENVAGQAVVLTESVKAHLHKLRETFAAGNKQRGNITANKLKFFLQLSPAQIESSCDFLRLREQEETTLITLCDAVPWAELQTDAASALFTGCFFHKMLTLETEASQTLLTAVTSIFSDQPKVVLDLLVKVIYGAKACEAQCQMLAMLCKKSLSLEWLSYLVRQLCETEGLTVTDSLCAVLQSVVDTRADLEAVTLTSLLTLLARGGACQDPLTKSARLGRCLLACFTKYSKKMTSEDFAVFSSMVDVHCSNLSRALQSALKRFNKQT